jgi:hypothetical protein
VQRAKGEAKRVHELKAQGPYDTILIVITAKHGQSAIDPSRYVSQLINPGFKSKTVYASVGTVQGIDPRALDAVRTEGTNVLPASFTTGDNARVGYSSQRFFHSANFAGLPHR